MSTCRNLRGSALLNRPFYRGLSKGQHRGSGQSQSREFWVQLQLRRREKRLVSDPSTWARGLQTSTRWASPPTLHRPPQSEQVAEPIPRKRGWAFAQLGAGVRDGGQSRRGGASVGGEPRAAEAAPRSHWPIGRPTSRGRARGEAALTAVGGGGDPGAEGTWLSTRGCGTAWR